MLGKILKNIANEYRLTVEGNTAYGDIGGFMVGLEGVNIMDISVYFADMDARDTVIGEIKNEKKRFGVADVQAIPHGIRVLFRGGKFENKLREFIGWYPTRLRHLGARGIDYCASCHQFLESGSVDVRMHGTACRMHEHCVDSFSREEDARIDETKSMSKRYIRGAIGALLGGIIGSIPWIIAYNYGWFVGWLGFLIGAAANKGYKILGGRPGKAKPLVIVLIVIVCVGLSLYISLAVGLAGMIASGELWGFAYKEIPALIAYTMTDPEVVSALITDFALSLVFAGLGCWSVIKEARLESKREVTAQIVRLGNRY